MRKRRFWMLVFLVSLMLNAIAFLIVNNLKDKEYVTVTAQKGDSIWSIAEEYSNQQNTASVVDWIIKENNLWEENLQVGQTIQVPILKEENEDIETVAFEE